jgi:hypothetical protein
MPHCAAKIPVLYLERYSAYREKNPNVSLNKQLHLMKFTAECLR